MMQLTMELEGIVALVTGANRGLGKAYAEALLDAGASKVYAGARNPRHHHRPAADAVQLDVTDAARSKTPRRRSKTSRW